MLSHYMVNKKKSVGKLGNPVQSLILSTLPTDRLFLLGDTLKSVNDFVSNHPEEWCDEIPRKGNELQKIICFTMNALVTGGFVQLIPGVAIEQLAEKLRK